MQQILNIAEYFEEMFCSLLRTAKPDIFILYIKDKRSVWLFFEVG